MLGRISYSSRGGSSGADTILDPGVFFCMETGPVDGYIYIYIHIIALL